MGGRTTGHRAEPGEGGTIIFMLSPTPPYLLPPTGQVTPETCRLGHSTRLLSLAGGELLVMPIKSLDA